MHVSQYQAHTASTAFYPEAGTGSNPARNYAMLGLNSECGELLIANSYDNVIKEFGDILWYLARLCEETQAMEFANLVTIRNHVDYSIVASTMVMGLSKIADANKKRTRDGFKGDEVEHARNELIEYGLISVFTATLSIVQYNAVNAGYDDDAQDIVDLAIHKNVNKLASRAERNVLEGSGDDR